MQNIHPLILCGGIGTRLWPLSRTQHPKQFQRIDAKSNLTFFQSTVNRQRLNGFEDPIIAVSSAHVHTVRRQLDDISCASKIIAEPVSRNTGPAVLAACLRLAETDPSSLVCILPSDHIINGDLSSNLLAMRNLASSGKIVLFGIKPDYPEPGFGYILYGDGLPGEDSAYCVERFVEKPTTTHAAEIIRAGNSLWASGISMFRADVLISEFMRLDPHTYEAVSSAVSSATYADGVMYLDRDAMKYAANLPTESIIFENSPDTVVSTLTVAWSDVGGWSALHHIGQKDSDDNVLNGDVVCLNTTGSYVRSSGKLIAVIGMENVVVVDTDDALLITTRDQSHEVKQLVRQLENGHRKEVVHHVRDQQAWGEVHSVQKGPHYEIRMIKVRTGTSLPFIAEERVHRMITITEGSGLLKSASITRPLFLGVSFEIAAAETATIFNGPEGEMQIVEIVCDAPVASVIPMKIPNRLVSG